jgi:hypothetical protein
LLPGLQVALLPALMPAFMLVLPAAPCQAAAYLPGADQVEMPDATLDTPTAPAAPAGTGVRWVRAPVRVSGSVALDLRWLRLEDGSRTSQALVYNDIDLATYLWQPWFAQLRAGFGVLADRTSASGNPGGVGASHATTGSLTGRVALSVFPASRFPFEIRADVSDSRVSGDNLGADYRSQRLGLTQSWRPLVGSENLLLNFEHSRLSSDTGTDTVDYVQASATRQSGAHSFEVNAAATRNERDDTLLGASAGARTRSSLATLGLRHGYRPDAATLVDTLASWHTLRFGRDLGTGDPELNSDLRQVASFATWRPGATGSFLQPDAPLLLSASLRWADASVNLGDSGPGSPALRERSVFGSLGATQELGRFWRAALGVSAGLVQPDERPGRLTRDVNASLGYTPASLMLGEWRYVPSAGIHAGFGDVRRRDTDASTANTATPPQVDPASSESGERRSVGAQLEHGASRSVLLGDGAGSLSLGVNQSVGVLHVSTASESSRGLAHGASLYWQSGFDASGGSSQSYAGLSLSDARTWAPEPARFQLVNLQVSQRAQLARHTSWSGDITLQASRSDATQIDPFSGALRMASQGWQRYANGAVTYEDTRFFNVPRLRYTALLSLHSQQFERRSLGDVDAPRERITQSLENRVDYSVGRLETRLAARYARIDGRAITALQARVLRRY